TSSLFAGVTSSIPLLENAPFKVKPKTELFDKRKEESPVVIDTTQADGIKGQEFTSVDALIRIPNENTLITPENKPVLLEPADEVADSLEPVMADKPLYDTILGSSEPSPQYGIIGEISNRKIALDLNQTHTISLFGVQGSGKSYTLGSIIEMACLLIGNINLLPNPLSTVVFHYSTTEDYKPEFVSMEKPNSVADQIKHLKDRYGATPQALKDIVLLTPKAKVEQRKLENPGLTVLPITFSSSELKTSHWKFLMGAVGSQSMYIRQVNFIMRKLRDNLKLEGILQEIDHSSLTENLKDLARTRLLFASEYIDDSRRLEDVIKPGRLIIVDLRDELIEKDEALGLFLVMLEIFSEATSEGRSYNKLVVFDEAHKYIENQDLITGLIEVVREMRHKGTNIMIASQEPRSVPVSIIELSTEIILHRFNSPEWLKQIQKANTALSSLTAEKMANLHPGEAYIWSSRSSDDRFTREAIKVKGRPRVTLHGGATKTAVSHNE
ncbi:MAG: ATP-binding protein, partial [Bacillota bacterium]